MDTGHHCRLTANELATALWGDGTFAGLNAGCYPGTKIRVRQVVGEHVLVIREDGRSPHVLDDGDGGWVAERFSLFTTPRLGEREYRRVLAFLAAKGA